MSSRRRIVTLSSASRDIADILLYTRKEWGADQRDQFRGQLDRALRSLASHPEMGRLRPDLYSGARSWVVGSYIVIYYVTDSELIVDRVIHTNRDFTEHFGE